MSRDDLEKLTKQELVELVLKLQRPAKTSRTSSTPPSRDQKEKLRELETGRRQGGAQGSFPRARRGCRPYHRSPAGSLFGLRACLWNGHGRRCDRPIRPRRPAGDHADCRSPSPSGCCLPALRCPDEGGSAASGDRLAVRAEHPDAGFVHEAFPACLLSTAGAAVWRCVRTEDQPGRVGEHVCARAPGVCGAQGRPSRPASSGRGRGSIRITLDRIDPK